MPKIKPKIMLLLFLIFFLSFSFFLFAAETITITTYYPSPYGSYRQLTANQIAIGSGYRNPTYADGTLYVQNNVGIGTVSPGQKLEVAGNVGITGAGNGVIFPNSGKLTTATVTVYIFPNYANTVGCSGDPTDRPIPRCEGQVASGASARCYGSNHYEYCYWYHTYAPTATVQRRLLFDGNIVYYY